MEDPAHLSRVEGDEDIYIGGLAALTSGRSAEHLSRRRITHVLSVMMLMPGGTPAEALAGRKGLVIQIDDHSGVDILCHLPAAVRFIDEGLRGGGAVLVHCAAGASRSVACVIAYLLWKHPERFTDRPAAAAAEPAPNPGGEPVSRALALIRRTHPLAHPNAGFVAQLERWSETRCRRRGGNLDDHDDYDHHHADAADAADAAAADDGGGEGAQGPDEVGGRRRRGQGAEGEGEGDGGSAGAPHAGLRCKKCRQILATSHFIADHGTPPGTCGAGCGHVYVEPLSWMRPTLDRGTLEGRLTCPGPRCGASVGRYSWRGFRCGCGEWVTPAFAIQRSRVDEEVAGGGAVVGIRRPPGQSQDPAPLLAPAT